MARAVFENGTIRPLSPPPPEWADGRELSIQEASGPIASCDESMPQSLEKWFQQFQALANEIDPLDHQTINKAVSEADESAKRQVRHEMGLSE